MDVERVLHMVGGAGDTSYSNNSSLQVSLSLSHHEKKKKKGIFIKSLRFRSKFN